MSQLEPRNPATPDDPRRSELPAPALARPLARLSALGQSVWVDFLSREALSGGEIARLIAQDSVVGATSNPTIFQQAMSRAGGYGEQRLALAADGVSDPRTIFWRLAERDMAAACDLFAPTWRASGGRDGYVSLEVDPRHAYDTLATYTEAMRIHAAVDRPNLMVKVPATTPGLAAVEDLIVAGRSVNVTLVFSLRRYADTAESYLRGLERLVADGGASTPPQTSACRPSVPTSGFVAGWGSRTPSSHTSTTRGPSPGHAGRRWRMPGRAPSGCCGRRRPRRTPRTRTPCMSKS
jgi:hypothetical protein